MSNNGAFTEGATFGTSLNSNKKVGVGSFIALAIALVFFSGLLSGNERTWLTSFDFSTLSGGFGKMTSESATFLGSGGSGAKHGFLFALSLCPPLILAMGLINVFDGLGALRAAQKLLTPLMRPLMGTPGVTAFILVTGLNSTDAAATMTKGLYEDGTLTENERLITVCWLFSGCGLLVNYFSSGAACFDALPCAIFIPLTVIIFCKFVGANIVRIAIALKSKKGAKNG